MREVKANLMFASGEGHHAQQGEGHGVGRRAGGAGEAVFDVIVSAGEGAIGADAVFDGDEAVQILAQGDFDGPLLCRHMTVHDGEVFLGDGAGFEDFAEFASGGGVLGGEHDAAGLAIEAVDQMGGGVRPQVQADAADEAGVFIALGGMADEAGGFVNDQQVVVFKNNCKQGIQNVYGPCRGSGRREDGRWTGERQGESLECGWEGGNGGEGKLQTSNFNIQRNSNIQASRLGGGPGFGRRDSEREDFKLQAPTAKLQ